MADALGQGYLTALIIGFFTGLPVFATTVLVPVVRWAGRRWSRQTVADKNDLETAYVEKSQMIVECTAELALCAIEKDTLISEVRRWRAGQVPPSNERYRP